MHESVSNLISPDSITSESHIIKFTRVKKKDRHLKKVLTVKQVFLVLSTGNESNRMENMRANVRVQRVGSCRVTRIIMRSFVMHISGSLICMQRN